MQYQQPRRYSAAEAEEVFRAGDAHGIAEALISVSLQLPDREWTERWLIHFSTHPHADVRRAAALALGHLARLHGEVSPQAVSVITRLLDDPELSGAAADAIDDVKMFAGERPE